MVFGVHVMKKKYYEIHPTRPVLARGLTSITITLIFFIHPPTVFLFMRCVADLYVLTAWLCFVVSFDRVRVRNPPILFLSTNRNFFLVSKLLHLSFVLIIYSIYIFFFCFAFAFKLKKRMKKKIISAKKYQKEVSSLRNL